MLTEAQRRKLLKKFVAETAAQDEIIAHARAVLPSERMADPVDTATAEESYRDAVAMIQRAETYRAKLISRRQDVESGDCCECRECGEDIPFQRLLIEPTATLCVPCKDIRGQKQQLRYGIRPGMRVLARA